jgi:hypothetical protein
MIKCAIPDCDSPKAKREWCNKHYLRWYKHGDPTHDQQRFTQCQANECTNRPRSTTGGLCEMHYYRKRRHGNALTVVNTRRDDSGYRAAHARIARDRGLARTMRCADCGTQAHHWSYRHDDPNEAVSPDGQPFSLDPTHYDPRCAPCHAVFDGTGANQYTR